MENNFQGRLKKAMADKKISASELSRISTVGKSDISNYINGKYLPKQDKVYLLAKALGVDPGWLITGVKPEQGLADRARIVVPDSERFVKLVSFMPQDEYIMVMEAFERADKRMREAEEAQQND